MLTFQDTFSFHHADINHTSWYSIMPVEGKSSECLICMKYWIIILIIIISLGQICYHILQTHHACTHARVHTRTCARIHARVHTREHTCTHTAVPAVRRTGYRYSSGPAVTTSSAGIHRGATFIAGAGSLK